MTKPSITKIITAKINEDTSKEIFLYCNSKNEESLRIFTDMIKEKIEFYYRFKNFCLLKSRIYRNNINGKLVFEQKDEKEEKDKKEEEKIKLK